MLICVKIKEMYIRIGELKAIYTLASLSEVLEEESPWTELFGEADMKVLEYMQDLKVLKYAQHMKSSIIEHKYKGENCVWF